MSTKLKEITKLIIVAIASAFFAVYLMQNRNSIAPSSTNYQTQFPPEHNAHTGTNFTSTDFTYSAEKSTHAVVHIKVKAYVQTNNQNNSFYDFFFRQRSEPAPVEGSGSGVIISPDGYIVTNNHVVNKSNEIEVVLNDKRTFAARLIGTDPKTDLALLKIEGDSLPTLAYGDSDNLKLGEWVLAVGNPFSLSTTVTAGIVSAKARGLGITASSTGVMGIESFIQTDAAVNPGNSGGALVNTNGELIGINSAIASPTGAYAGYSFAIPVSIVKKVVSDLMEFGTVQRAILGISIADISASLAEKENLGTLSGVYINQVMKGSSAEDADLQKGDIIIKIDNHTIKSTSELMEQINRYRPGDKIGVSILRSNKPIQVEVSLKNADGNTLLTQADAIDKLGGTFEEVSDRERRALNINHGVKIVELTNGLLARTGIKTGYIITQINNTPIKTISDIKKTYKNLTGGMFITGIYPNGKVAYYAVNVDN